MRGSGNATLIVTADDYGLGPCYDAGILEAATAGALDAVSVMVLREPDPEPLLATEVEIGLHLEPLATAALDEQFWRFQGLFARPPAHLDGHHHCHAQGRPAVKVARLARRLRLPVRSVTARHRRLLRCLGVPTQDRLIGRLDERDPAMPPEIEAVLAGSAIPAGVSEWMVHPGRADSGAGSSYDAGREEDLRLVLELGRREELVALRATHAVALL
jgi:predicted glycoside hydrolase/deacetylase ChbG (UPF0249 family)